MQAKERNTMKVFLPSAALAAMLSTSAYAQLEPKAYAEFSYAHIHVNTGGYSSKPALGIIIVGLDLNEYLAVELLGATGTHNGSFKYAENTFVIDVDSALGGYLKVGGEVGPKLRLFGKIGVIRSRVTASSPPEFFSQTETNISYGAGIEYNFSDVVYLQSNYISYYNAHGKTAHGPAIAFGFRF